MANLDKSLEDFYAMEVAKVPVGLGTMILAMNGISKTVDALLGLVAEKMSISDPMQLTMLKAGGTAGAAWLMSNYADDVVGEKTAKLASAVIVAAGADSIVGGMLPEKDGAQPPLTQRLYNFVSNLGRNETKTSKSPAVESGATQTQAVTQATQGSGSYQFNMGHLPRQIPTFEVPVNRDKDISSLVLV